MGNAALQRGRVWQVDMPELLKGFVLLSLLVATVGCAEVEPGEANATSRPITVACVNDVDPTQTVFVGDWRLEVTPQEPIQSGQPFAASLGGVVVFSEDFVSAGHVRLLFGAQVANLVELNATVQVRSGADPTNVTLVPDPELYPYECKLDGRPCDPVNDVIDDPLKLAGMRANEDCEPVEDFNPCGRFLFLPTSTDCQPGGQCERLGKTNECDTHRSCITGDFEIQLKHERQDYLANAEQQVLFGWADRGTGAICEEGVDGSGYEICTLSEIFESDALYQQPAGPMGIRATFGSGLRTGLVWPVAFECTMAVNCQDFGCLESQPTPSRTPSSELIAFPIATEAP